MRLHPTLEAKQQTMQQIIRDMGSVVVAFSGGIDSSLVLKVAHGELGDRAIAVTAVSATLPERELQLARSIAMEIGAAYLEMPAFSTAAEFRAGLSLATIHGRLSPSWIHLFSRINVWRGRLGLKPTITKSEPVEGHRL